MLNLRKNPFRCLLSSTLFSTELPTDRQPFLLQMSKCRLPNPPNAMKYVPSLWVRTAYEALLNTPMLHLENGCIITLANPSQSRPQFSGRYGCGQKYSLHAAPLTLRAKGRYPAYQFMQASHLCGNGRCINADHLKWEFPSENVDRDLCHKWDAPFTCEERGHDPPCIPQTDLHRKRISHELSMARGAVKRRKKRN